MLRVRFPSQTVFQTLKRHPFERTKDWLEKTFPFAEKLSFQDSINRDNIFQKTYKEATDQVSRHFHRRFIEHNCRF
jgi:hypothetical protein